MASSSRLLVRRKLERLEGVKAWGRSDTRRHLVGLGLKTEGSFGAVGLPRWRACGAKLEPRRRKVVKTACPRKKMDENALERVIGRVSSVGAKLSFSKRRVENKR